MQIRKIMQNENGSVTQTTWRAIDNAFGGATRSITVVDTSVLDYKVSTSFSQINCNYSMKVWSSIGIRFMGLWILEVVSFVVAIIRKVRWPVSLVPLGTAVTKYQFIFRHLFHCKHVKRPLCAAWQIHWVRHTSFRATYYTLSLRDNTEVSLNAGPKYHILVLIWMFMHTLIRHSQLTCIGSVRLKIYHACCMAIGHSPVWYHGDSNF